MEDKLAVKPHPGERPDEVGSAAEKAAIVSSGALRPEDSPASSRAELRAIREAFARVEAEAKATSAAQNRANAEARARDLAETRAAVERVAAIAANQRAQAEEAAIAAQTERLAAEQGLLTLPGPFFGPGQERHLRLAFANVDAHAIAEIPARLKAL